jgi:hypothetical protein
LHFFILIHLTSGIDYFNNYRYNIEKSTPFYCSEYCHSYDYAESIYNKKDESPYLNTVRLLFVNEEKAKSRIKYTKYFGCGTFFVCFAILILFWR